MRESQEFPDLRRIVLQPHSIVLPLWTRMATFLLAMFLCLREGFECEFSANRSSKS